ncbi:MAG: NAD(+) diphosphatase [Prevotella sp.]|nr:NAD(+) diphosphatase [Prevotella sp.]MBQ9223577.1 NAD(+) diphosphatase [Prevotella sp.]
MERKYWFVFCKGDLLLEKTSDGRYTIPYQEEAPTPLKEWTNVHTITPFGDDDVRTYTIDGPVTDNPRYEMCGLRATYNKLPHELYQIAGKCQEILYWDANTRFCGVCGGPMKMHTEISKRCTHCGKEIWPLLATAIIVLIRREDKVLLVHARNFRGKFFGLVAGFVETGETLEEAVVREVHEEVGIKIKNIRYFASQPWPYPCGLMVGFTADYVSGELHLQRSELDDAGWFDRDHLPPVPDKMSIARQLIDSWLEESSK